MYISLICIYLLCIYLSIYLFCFTHLFIHVWIHDKPPRFLQMATSCSFLWGGGQSMMQQKNRKVPRSSSLGPWTQGLGAVGATLVAWAGIRLKAWLFLKMIPIKQTRLPGPSKGVKFHLPRSVFGWIKGPKFKIFWRIQVGTCALKLPETNRENLHLKIHDWKGPILSLVEISTYFSGEKKLGFRERLCLVHTENISKRWADTL